MGNLVDLGWLLLLSLTTCYFKINLFLKPCNVPKKFKCIYMFIYHNRYIKRKWSIACRDALKKIWEWLLLYVFIIIINKRQNIFKIHIQIQTERKRDRVRKRERMYSTECMCMCMCFPLLLGTKIDMKRIPETE